MFPKLWRILFFACQVAAKYKWLSRNEYLSYAKRHAELEQKTIKQEARMYFLMPMKLKYVVFISQNSRHIHSSFPKEDWLHFPK